jgi:hypothetical protein
MRGVIPFSTGCLDGGPQALGLLGEGAERLGQEACLPFLVVAPPRPVVAHLVQIIQHPACLLAAHVAPRIRHEAIRGDSISAESVFAESCLRFRHSVQVIVACECPVADADRSLGGPFPGGHRRAGHWRQGRKARGYTRR